MPATCLITHKNTQRDTKTKNRKQKHTISPLSCSALILVCLFFLINSLFVTQKSITKFFFRFYLKEINNFPDVFEWSLSWLRVCTEDSTWCVRGTKLFLFSPAVFTQQNINSSTTNVWNKFIILFSSVREFFQLSVFVSFNSQEIHKTLYLPVI